MPKNIFNAEWTRLLKQEDTFLKKRAEKKVTKLDAIIAEKIPQKLQDTLNLAFSKSFAVVFDRGTSVIEKSYNRQNAEHTHKVNAYAFSIRQDKKRARAFEKEVAKSEAINVLISGAKGIGLGLLGIGLPDIPVFIGVVLKGIYEIALQYGYDYDSDEERYFILNIIATSMLYGDEVRSGDSALNEYITTSALPPSYDRNATIDKVASVLSNELLYMKFVQGVPLVGVVGGLSDAVFVKKILGYAKLKYKRRFLYNQLNP